MLTPLEVLKYSRLRYGVNLLDIKCLLRDQADVVFEVKARLQVDSRICETTNLGYRDVIKN